MLSDRRLHAASVLPSKTSSVCRRTRPFPPGHRQSSEPIPLPLRRAAATAMIPASATEPWLDGVTPLGLGDRHDHQEGDHPSRLNFSNSSGLPGRGTGEHAREPACLVDDRPAVRRSVSPVRAGGHPALKLPNVHEAPRGAQFPAAAPQGRVGGNRSSLP